MLDFLAVQIQIDAAEFFLETAETGNHAEQIVQRAEFFNLLKLFEEIRQREFIGFDFLNHFFSGFGIDCRLRLFNQAEHVAHAENPGRHAVGVENLQSFEFFAHAHEFYRATGCSFYGQCRAAASVAVEFG